MASAHTTGTPDAIPGLEERPPIGGLRGPSLVRLTAAARQLPALAFQLRTRVANPFFDLRGIHPADDEPRHDAGDIGMIGKWKRGIVIGFGTVGVGRVYRRTRTPRLDATTTAPASVSNDAVRRVFRSRSSNGLIPSSSGRRSMIPECCPGGFLRISANPLSAVTRKRFSRWTARQISRSFQPDIC